MRTLPSSSLVARHQAERGGRLATGPESGGVAHCGHDCCCRQHADPRNVRDPMAGATTGVPQLEPAFDFADLPVELDNARPLLAQGLQDHRRQPLDDLFQGCSYPLVLRRTGLSA